LAIVDAPSQDRVVVYMDPDLSRRLRLEKAETRKSISSIVNSMIREYYRARDRGRDRAQPPDQIK
jgi:hypothetical protein